MYRILNSNPDGGKSLPIRFIEVANQRFCRRLWLKDLETRRDYGAIFYLADVRDHPMLLLTARTANWFLSVCGQDFEIQMIVLYTNQRQIDDFLRFVPNPPQTFFLCETEEETVAAYIQRLKDIGQQFSEIKRIQSNLTASTFWTGRRA
jgi:hypothetical protein